MTAPIDFWFDFTSPYSYLAAEQIDALAAKHGRTVRWQPMLLGAIFKEIGGRPLTEIPLKGEYSKRDFARSARFHGLAFNFPAKFPQATVSAARAYYWLAAQDEALARRFALAVFRKLFAEAGDVSDLGTVIELAAALGVDRDALSAGVASAEIKDKLREVNEQALKLGIFGAPYILIDGEPFWGADRLPQIDKWLATGGF